jgi:cytochrome c peroxidase
MKKIRLFLPVLAVAILATSCAKKSDFNYYYYTPEEYAVLSQTLDLPELPDDYTIEFPTHLRNQGLFARGIERDKAILGRVLFYDKNLSKDRTVSCGSCHIQSAGFGDTKAVSAGVQSRAGDRNSIALTSVANFSAYYGTDLNGSQAIRFFWDNRAETAALQSRGSLTNPKEMDMHMEDVAKAVQAQPYYVPLFKRAFGDANVSQDRVLEALANFVNAIGSYQSRFDEAASQVAGFDNYDIDFPKPLFSESENRGKTLYMKNCASCHSRSMGRPVLFNASNGLDLNPTDNGVYDVTKNPAEKGTFKVPTLRNIAVSAPYMHDGRFKTLEDVVDFYSTGIKAHANLHPNLKPGGFKFEEGQKKDLIAFLNTLTDQRAAESKRFSNPFKQ